MKPIFRLLSLALLAPLFMGTLRADDDAASSESKPKKEQAAKDKNGSKKKTSDDGNYISKSIPSWGNPDAAQKSLAAQIQRALKSPEPENVVNFVESPKNRLMVAQYMLAQYDKQTPAEWIADRRKSIVDKLAKLPGEIQNDNEKLRTMRGKERMAFMAAIKAKKESIKQLEAELKNSPWTLAELAHNRDGSKILKEVTGNLEWMENICFSGPCQAPGRALHIIASIAKQHPDVYKDKVVRDIATAVGIEYARYGWDFNKALDRADYYITNWKAGRLNSLFDTLPMYLRRIVCGCKGDNIAGDRISLEWALDNVHVPAERYMGSPHRLGYRLYNLYGDSIHGADYYMPWEHLYGGNHFTRSLYVGCVCGGISHFGAFAALANGVPSLTCGEPGHCAYVLWVNGKWVPGNSVSWERGLHWQPILNMYGAFSSLHLGSELYTKLDKDTHVSNTYRVLAHHAAATRKDKLALNYFKDATTAQPINIGVWQEYNNYLTFNKGEDMKLLCEMQDNLCYTVAPRYPEVISEFLANWVYPKMKAAKLPAAELMTRYHVFWDNVTKMGPERWRIEKFGRRQIELLQYQDPPDGKEIPPPDPKLALPVFNLMMNSLASKGDYLPVVIGWGEEMAKDLGGTHASTIATLSKEISKTGTGAMGGDNEQVTGQLMLSAAKAKDISTFQRLGTNSAAQVQSPSDMPELPEMSGKLLSADGLLATSSTCGHDSPVSHWGVIRPIGGRFHTDKEENPWASVMMPKPGYINGVVIVTTGSNMGRQNNMVVQISDDGESWSTIKELGECNERVIKLEFQERLGRHIRVLRKGGPEFFHLHGIYVFGRDAA